MLALGTIVYLKEGTRKLVILNRGPIVEIEGVQLLFDYTGSFYPQGLAPGMTFYFNEENIDKIVFEGFTDEEEVRYQKLYEDWLNSKENNYKKGEAIKKL